MTREQMVSNINGWVDSYCQRHNVKKEAIAESIGMSRTTFYVKLSGKTDFSVFDARSMSELFGCSVCELLDTTPTD